ncbi:MAG: hypothetical protein Tsb0020_35070 [Haliangiales bacterium]
MKIRRIQIPHFRALQDVDLTFEPGFEQQIFPLGSRNGGGKSTLLQLIFTLLKCSSRPKQHHYLRNILSDFIHPPDVSEKRIASITLSFDDRAAEEPAAPAEGLGAQIVPEVPRTAAQDLELQFLSLGPRLLKEMFDDESSAFGFEVFRKGPKAQWADHQSRIKHFLKAKNLLFITTFSPHSSPPAQGPGYAALAARVAGKSHGRLEEQLARASKSIFLLGPSMQQYLFLERAYRRSLVATSESYKYAPLENETNQKESAAIMYARVVATAETKLPGFFAYDWLSIEPLLRLFQQARDQDFADVVKTGRYGNHYTTMLNEINSLLHHKHVRPLEDLSGIQFTTQSPGGEEVALDLEDLSRGELKRLMIYAWLKANQTDGGVVLIDEIEVSFHPDWQSGIVRELWEWAPQNQYILATHSYEVCEALTPAHIRELAPKLATNPNPKTNASGS